MSQGIPKAVALRTESDRSVLVETDLSIDLPAKSTVAKIEGVLPGDQPVGRVDDLIARLNDVQELVRSCCESVYAGIPEGIKPKKVGLELGIKFAGEMGVPVLTKASGEASLKVTVEWAP